MTSTEETPQGYISTDQIPPGAVEAAKSAYAEVYWADEATPKAFRAAIQSAIAAALAAWPGATTEPRNWRTAIILPLAPQETGE